MTSPLRCLYAVGEILYSWYDWNMTYFFITTVNKQPQPCSCTPNLSELINCVFTHEYCTKKQIKSLI